MVIKLIKLHLVSIICTLSVLSVTNAIAGFVIKKTGDEHLDIRTLTSSKLTAKKMPGIFHNTLKSPGKSNYYLDQNGNSFKGAMALLCGLGSVAMTTIGLFNITISSTLIISGTTGILLLLGAMGTAILAVFLASGMHKGIGNIGMAFGLVTIVFFLIAFAIAGAASGNLDLSGLFDD